MLILGLGVAIWVSDSVYRWFVRVVLRGRAVNIRRCEDHHIEAVYSMATRHFGESVTEPRKIKMILSRFHDGLQLALMEDPDKQEPATVGGYFFMFPISRACVEKILDYSFDVSSLAKEDIASKARYGHAIYIGGIVADRLATRAELLGALKMSVALAQQTRTKTAYARAATASGLRILEKHDFHAVHPAAQGVGYFYRRVFS